MLRQAAISGFLAAALALGTAGASAASKEDRKAALTRVQDLHYGDVLFQSFMGEDLEALIRLEAYDSWSLLPHHQGEAELLAGGLYLQLGMYNEAGRRFESLLAQSVPPSVQARAWFYLAKVWYVRGYYDRSTAALRRIESELTPAQQAERVHMEANALLELERYDEAIDLLAKWRSESSWMQYARFNLGAALARVGRLNDAVPFLDAVGQLDTDNEELLALKDKANLAQGFAWLQGGEAAKALPVLERVRLQGPQSSRALLGLGWAYTALGRHEDALTPWIELKERNLLDAAVQEAYLAVPYAFAQLGANGQAAQYYEEALNSFQGERGRIDVAVSHIREGSLMQNLLGSDDANSPQRGWFWQLQALPDAPESRYLYPVLAGNDFQEGLKNFRDLAYVGSVLARWDENMVVYDDMIDTREQAYAERVPRADALLGSAALDNLTARRKTVEGRINDVVNLEDVAALGTPEQREQWQRIADIEVGLMTQPDGEETAAAREKLRLVKGVLYWDLRQIYPERLYQQRRELRSLDKLLAESHGRWLRVEEARRTAPTTTGDFGQRIAALQARLAALRARIDTAATAQEGLLAGIATGELEAQRQRLVDYEEQARFALATIYDRAAEAAPPPASNTPPAGGTP